MTPIHADPLLAPRTSEAYHRARERYVAARRILMISGAVLVAVTLGLGTWAILETRATALQVEACTTPGQPCYERLAADSRERIQVILDEQEDGSIPARETLAQSQANGNALADIVARLESAGCIPAR